MQDPWLGMDLVRELWELQWAEFSTVMYENWGCGQTRMGMAPAPISVYEGQVLGGPSWAGLQHSLVLTRVRMSVREALLGHAPTTSHKSWVWSWAR